MRWSGLVLKNDGSMLKATTPVAMKTRDPFLCIKKKIGHILIV